MEPTIAVAQSARPGVMLLGQALPSVLDDLDELHLLNPYTVIQDPKHGARLVRLRGMADNVMHVPLSGGGGVVSLGMASRALRDAYLRVLAQHHGGPETVLAELTQRLGSPRQTADHPTLRTYITWGFDAWLVGRVPALTYNHLADHERRWHALIDPRLITVEQVGERDTLAVHQDELIDPEMVQVHAASYAGYGVPSASWAEAYNNTTGEVPDDLK